MLDERVLRLEHVAQLLNDRFEMLRASCLEQEAELLALRTAFTELLKLPGHSGSLAGLRRVLRSHYLESVPTGPRDKVDIAVQKAFVTLADALK